MSDEEMLDRTNRINTLFDFYSSLLTKKQQSILSLYYQENFSLGEIAAEFQVSRQAVYEHLKRAEQALTDYENKLQLVKQHSRRIELTQQLADWIGKQADDDRQRMLDILKELQK